MTGVGACGKFVETSATRTPKEISTGWKSLKALCTKGRADVLGKTFTTAEESGPADYRGRTDRRPKRRTIYGRGGISRKLSDGI